MHQALPKPPRMPSATVATNTSRSDTLPSPVLQPVDEGQVQNPADMFLARRKTSAFHCTLARLELVSVPSESQTLIHGNDLPAPTSCSDLNLQTIKHQADYSSGSM
jgi:hypothetical protein